MGRTKGSSVRRKPILLAKAQYFAFELLQIQTRSRRPIRERCTGADSEAVRRATGRQTGHKRPAHSILHQRESHPAGAEHNLFFAQETKKEGIDISDYTNA